MFRLFVLGGVLAAAGGGGWWYYRAKPVAAAPGAHATAKKGSFSVPISAQGTFAAKDSMNLELRPEVYNGPFTITMVVAAGTSVKKGDVLMEFEQTEVDRLLSQAAIEEQAAKNDVVQATSDLGIQHVNNRIALEKAKSDHEAAILTLKKWVDLEAPKAVKEAEARIRETENALAEAKSSLEVLKQMQEEELVAEAEVKKAELAAAKATTDLEFNMLALQLLRNFDHPLQTSKLETAVRDAKSNLEGLESSSAAQIAQKESAKLRAENALKEKSSYLEKLKTDKDNLVLKAPVEGILLYGNPEHYWNNQKIAVGEKVGSHNTLLTIPDLSALKVKMAVPEADVNKIKEGLVASIKPEALPDLTLQAKVTRVSTVSTNSRPWDDSSTGKFDVELDLEGVDPKIKPGMRCKVEIVTEEVVDVVFVPVDAVQEKDGKPICWVLNGERPEERAVKPGRSSHDYVEITEGLKEGDKVALYDPNRADK
jgi:RND family efflux transporter MFP subunit